MKFTGLDVFDATIQRTNVWLKDLMQELNWSDRRKTYLALRGTLHTLRDHVPVADAMFLGDQLPMLIRGMYFEHWNPEEKPQQLKTREDFFSVLTATMSLDGEPMSGAETIVRAVFRLLERKSADGEIRSIQHLVPAALHDLWPPGLRAA